ncbi:Uncharacterized protein Fot_14241 [Forsythia ovata]|uniref:Uncharacterized protein n=1 Tax=Forsythia ovata TaxID=205694 RepID=A0ABD1W5S2_9LAMI
MEMPPPSSFASPHSPLLKHSKLCSMHSRHHQCGVFEEVKEDAKARTQTQTIRMCEKSLAQLVHENHCPTTKKNKEWQEKLPVVVLKVEEIILGLSISSPPWFLGGTSCDLPPPPRA